MRGRTFGTRDEAWRAVSGYIEGWYNPHRRHSALGYESPVSYERRYQSQEGLGNEAEAEREPAGVGADADGDRESKR